MVDKNVTKNRFTPFTANELTPKGWLLQQLRIQADGLSGNLDKMWPDIRDSRWIGGNRDGWERVPYWLDGFIPLAYLLRDEDMIARAKKYVDAIIENQKPDGWICPCEDNQRAWYDMWPAFLICKVLVLYYECSKDPRVEEVVYKTLKNLLSHIRNHTIFNWAASRWFECLIPIFWLYERRKEDWLIYLALLLRAQGLNYRNVFTYWMDEEPKRIWSFNTHVVNLAMALKSEPLISKVTKEDGIDFAKKMQSMLLEYHGTPIGHFSGDECLSGTSPIQGTELCSIVEAMYSYQVLFGITADTFWADKLEEHAFNSFPATNSPDMWTHQYLQQVNQIACVKFEDKVIFRTNGPEAHLFGLEPNFGCCTANFNQAWPKFALTSFMKGENGEIASVSLIPSTLETEVNGTKVKIDLDTLYPFRSKLKYTVSVEFPVSFDFQIRIPRFVKSATVGGKVAPVGGMYSINKEWSGTEVIEVEFELVPEFVDCPSGMKVLRRGPLFYSVAIEEEWTMHEYSRHGVDRKFPYCDYEIRPLSKWNYAFSKDAEKTIKVVENDSFDRPFSSTNPPIYLTCDMVEIDWGMEPRYTNLCAEKPNSTTPLTDPYPVKFHPYGATNLRMTEMPKVE